MAKTCGQCKLTKLTNDPKIVWCYGGPPTVLSFTQTPEGHMNVNSQRPLLPVTELACGTFVQKPRVRK